MKPKIPTITLNNGVEMPILGLGTWKLTGKKCEKAVKDALLIGYDHIDTAAIYGNHKEIGKAIKEEKIDRKKLFITTKVWYNDLGYDDVLAAFDKALLELGTSYIDLYLIHWPNRNIPFKETFKALKKLYDEKKVRAIGVSNFSVAQLNEAIGVSEVPISVNQVEFHPYLYQKDLLLYCKKNKIILEAYSPLSRGNIFGDKIIGNIAKKHGKSESQIVLRWLIEKGAVVIPKASSFEHLKENLEVFDFKLDKDDTLKIDSIDRQSRMISPGLAEFFMSIGYNVKKAFKKRK